MKSILFAVSLLISGFAHADPNCSGAFDKTFFYDFSNACFKHDVCYSEGPLLGLDKKQCDVRFYFHMKTTCRGSLPCIAAASAYYMAVAQFPYERFWAASQKSVAIKRKIDANHDQQAMHLFAQRALAQDLWSRKNMQCYWKFGNARIACLQERDAIQVPDIPGTYHLGDCNTLGVRWKNGDRLTNAHYISELLGVPYEVVTDPNIDGDPCKGHYKD